MRKIVWLLIGSVVLYPNVALAQRPLHKVVFALTSPDQVDWSLTVNNLGNLIRGIPQGGLEIELVAYGPGIAFLSKRGPNANDIEQLESAHVHFAACKNSMRKQHMQLSDMVSGVEEVPSGVVEVVLKQEAGWSYVKAGR